MSCPDLTHLLYEPLRDKIRQHGDPRSIMPARTYPGGITFVKLVLSGISSMLATPYENVVSVTETEASLRYGT